MLGDEVNRSSGALADGREAPEASDTAGEAGDREVLGEPGDPEAAHSQLAE